MHRVYKVVGKDEESDHRFHSIFVTSGPFQRVYRIGRPTLGVDKKHPILVFEDLKSVQRFIGNEMISPNTYTVLQCLGFFPRLLPSFVYPDRLRTLVNRADLDRYRLWVEEPHSFPSGTVGYQIILPIKEVQVWPNSST